MTENNPLLEKKLQEVDERLDKKFAPFKDQPIMQYIAKLAKEYLKAKIKLS
jgi:hypothetical protein